jgi:hypothetical protein
MITYDKNLGTKQKALRINLDRRIYGSFAEIGAGQDVAANFLKLVVPLVRLPKLFRLTTWHFRMLFMAKSLQVDMCVNRAW